jgi:hypothetical protein
MSVDPEATEEHSRPDPTTYLRRVSFLDAVPPGERGPSSLGELVHAAQRVLFDGVEISPYVVDLREGWSTFSCGNETVVSFSTRSEAITPPVFNDAGDRHVEAPQICGRSVFTPRTPWEEYDRDTRPSSGLFRAPARMVRVYIFVPEVEIRAAVAGEVSTLGWKAPE